MVPVEPLVPLFVKLAGRPVLVVGAGPMGAARARQLVEAGARVTVVAPEVRPEAAAAAAVVLRRPFLPEDLDGMWFAVAAAPPEVNRAVAEAAEARRVLLNAVDDPARASAYFPAVIRRGGATVALSTDGRAPALAGLLREGLSALLPEDLAAWLATAEGLRAGWKAARVPLADRRPLLLQRLNALYASGPGGGAASQERPGEALPGSSA
jgi:uroporphyrin-III C-methyltransferase/precorrin-2 dehydrogenase/sirohydrochlorin ferrochelatase